MRAMALAVNLVAELGEVSHNLPVLRVDDVEGRLHPAVREGAVLDRQPAVANAYDLAAAVEG